MTDETEDCSKMEQVSVLFSKVEIMDAQYALISAVQRWGLDLSFLVGQGFDGASVIEF